MRILLDKTNMSAEDWQEYRKNQKGIGGSDVATILGLNPYKSPFTLWLEKTGQVEPPDLGNNEYVNWGNILEPVIREEFKKVTGFEVVENDFVLQHDIHDFMVANIDGEVFDPAFNGEPGVLEIKTANERMKEEWREGPPHYYMLQIQHYLAVLDYSYAYVAVLIGGNHFKYFRIVRDDYVIDKIIAAEMEFMNLVETNTPPEISAHPKDSEYLSETYSKPSEEEGFLTSESERKALRYIEIQEEMKMLQEEADFIKNKIKYEAKECKALVGENVKILMPAVKKLSFDNKKFAVDHPELHAAYKNKEINYRNFSVKPIRRE